MTINRFCSSGLQAVALAADRIRLGEADLMIAGGTESMSMVPMMGNKIALNAGGVRKRRERRASPTAWASPPRRSPSNGRSRARTQDAFALASHQKALAAIAGRRIQATRSRRTTVDRRMPDLARQRSCTDARSWSTPTKARARTPRSKGWPSCKPGVRARGGTRHRRQQLADVRRRRRPCCWRREQAIKDYGLTPLARFVGFAVAGVRAGNHGHRPDRRDPEGAEAGRHRRRTSSTGSS